LGPTAIHLQHELILLATLCIFTSASFYTTYHSHPSIIPSTTSSSYSTSYYIVAGCINFLSIHRNEFLYVIFSTIWLARHLLHRIICTTDVNTSILSNRTLTKNNNHYQLHPTWLSTLYKVYIWLSCDGQYFDIPFCPLNLATYEEDTSASSISTTTAKTMSASSSGGVNQNKLRTIIQISNVKSPPSIHYRHNHHHYHATESLLHRETPPLHRIYIIQTLFIIPFLVIPISIMKYLFNLLRSRKRPNHEKYYDSDDDDDDFNNHISHNNHKNKHHTNTSSSSTTSSSNNNNHNNANNHNSFSSSLSSTIPFSNNNDDDILLWDNDNINDEYIHIHIKTQRRINTKLDTLWNYIPSIQCILYVVTFILMLHIGMKFYSTYMHNRHYERTISSNNGLFYLDKKMNDLQLNNILAPQQQQQQQQQQQMDQHNHKLSALGVQNGIHSTALNSKLMEYKFKVKQQNYFGGISKSSGTSSRGNNSYSSRRSRGGTTNLRGKELFYHYCLKFTSMVSEKIGIRNWLVALYGPWGMFYLMTIWGIVGSLLFFGRIMLPIPDLTAGGRDNWTGRGSNVSRLIIVKYEINLNAFLVSFILLF
jgi:hypothetical protein